LVTVSERYVRVLTVTPFYPSETDGGQGCFIAEPLPWLERMGISTEVLAAEPFYRAHVRASNSAPKAKWVRYFSLPTASGLSTAGVFLFARILPLVRRLHQERSIDVIHAHAPLPCGHAGALLSKELGIPLVVSVHGLDAFSTNQRTGVSARWCERVSRMVLLSAARVVCISRRVRDEVLRGAAEARTEVVYNGVDPDLFCPRSDERAEPNHTVLSIGDLIPIKGHDALIRALASLGEKHRNVRLAIIGAGPERGNLETLAEELGVASRVEFLGRRSRQQVAEALRSCTVFALPSRYEGLGCVYLEAMSSGKPAIACVGQGIAEIIRSGTSGILVEPGSVEQVAAAMAGLLDNADDRRRMGTAARYTILQGLTLEHQAQRLAAVYEECLG
jgi:teichuronic acid biosynthesis glycosyltransferase TuaC